MKTAVRLALLLLLRLLLSGGGWAAETAPVDPKASSEARKVLAFLQSIQGRQVLSGHHVIYGEAKERELDFLVRSTDRSPALIEFEAGAFAEKGGEEFMAIHRQIVRDAIDYWRGGGLVAMCWHWGNPLQRRNTYPHTKLRFDLPAALTNGTPEHAALMKDLEVTAALLAQLRDAGVPVLWRPLHESCGGWFWWGMEGREPAQRLWRLVFQHFTQTRDLHNLLWVYSASHDLRMDWFPGTAYADIVGADLYRPGLSGDRATFDRVAGVAGAKPVALTECDVLPDPDRMLERGFLWNWVTTWHSQYVRKNSAEVLRRFYQHPKVLTRDELPRF